MACDVPDAGMPAAGPGFVAHGHVPGVRWALGAAVVTVTACERCASVAGDLAEAKSVISQVRWVLMDVVMWGGKQLDSADVDLQAVAEGLLDRIGAVLATVPDGRTSPGAGGAR